MPYAGTGPVQDNPMVQSMKMNQLLQVFGDKQGYMEGQGAPITGAGQRLPSGSSLMAALMPGVGPRRGTQVPPRAPTGSPNAAGVKGKLAQARGRPRGRMPAGAPMAPPPMMGAGMGMPMAPPPMMGAGMGMPGVGGAGAAGGPNQLQMMALLAMMQQGQGPRGRMPMGAPPMMGAGRYA